jgi:drug/metabolite transporter (DMT)-like permease
VVYLKLFLTALFWGGTFIAGRQVAQDLGPYSIAFLRFALASALLLGLIRLKEGRLPRLSIGQLPLVLLLGLTGIFAYNVLFFKGLRLIEASRAALIVATCPAFIALASVVFLREKLIGPQVIGIPLSILGAAVVISKGDLHRIAAGGIGPGELFIVGCVLSWAVYSLVGKVVLRRLSPLASVSYSSLAGAAALALPALSEDLPRTFGHISALDWTSIVYLAVFGTVLGFVWFYEGIRVIGATRAGLFINFVPISAVVLAFFLLGEPVTWSLALGAALVLSGVYMTNRVARPSKTGDRQTAAKLVTQDVSRQTKRAAQPLDDHRSVT